MLMPVLQLILEQPCRFAVTTHSHLLMNQSLCMKSCLFPSVSRRSCLFAVRQHLEMIIAGQHLGLTISGQHLEMTTASSCVVPVTVLENRQTKPPLEKLNSFKKKKEKKKRNCHFRTLYSFDPLRGTFVSAFLPVVNS